jgi:TonB family protein
MKQKTYSPLRKLKLLLVLPLIAGVFYAFATPEYKFVQTGNSSETIIQAQEGKIVKGKIVNDEGQPLKGANIVISGTTIGTISDASGNFELKMTDESPLVVTYVGYGTRRVKPDFSKEMVIQTGRITIGIDSDGNNTTASDPSFLSSPPLFVVDGKEITKSEMEKIDPDKIESIDVLKNKEFTKKYGEKGKDGVVLITLKKEEQTSQTFKVQSNSPLKFGDANSFGKQPLIIVDGVIEMQDVNNIPPETIESINVLKKESLTKIYGDKGKNGVILITTKKGASASQNTPIDVKVTGYANNQNENTSTNTGVKIRSTGTFTNPLIVVDGIISETKKVEDFDPETIQSINVLKGESATQKYGEKGKDGVLEITMKKSENTFISVEEIPEFPGGTEAINPFIKANLQYPKKAVETGITGKVFVDFTITKTGKVETVKVSKGLHPLLDAEAVRVVKSMPNWKPGVQNGEKVDVKYQLSVSFFNPSFKQKEN